MSFISKLFSGQDKNAPQMVDTAGALASAPLSGGELIAVITAAISAYEDGRRAPNSLIVRRIRRVPEQMPVWSRAGLSECIDNRKM
jgi:hypothetical protein